VTLLLPIRSLFIDHLYAPVQSQIKSGPYLCPGSGVSRVFECVLVGVNSHALVRRERRRGCDVAGGGKEGKCYVKRKREKLKKER